MEPSAGHTHAVTHLSEVEVAIVGAGPAGLMAADILSAEGHAIAVFDRMPSPGRKFLMAGRGGLNLTHAEDLDGFLKRFDTSSAYISESIQSFTPSMLRTWADELGAETFAGSSQRVFPKALKASPLLRALLRRLDERGVTLRLGQRWLGWNNGRLVFAAERPRTNVAAPEVCHVRADATILALGGASWPKLGSDGAWATTLCEAGVGVTPLTAFNAGALICWSDILLSRHEGAPLKRAAISIATPEDIETRRGEAVITRDGLEGGVIYALNTAILSALTTSPSVTIAVDLRPDLPTEALAERLTKPHGRQSMANVLRKSAGLSPAAIALVREPHNGELPSEPRDLARLIKAVPLQVDGLNGLARAISTRGGVQWNELSEEGMLIKHPGTFLAGEMLDWAAPTGGYLLQATFATAARAAHGAMRWLQCGKSGDAQAPLA